MSSRSLMRRVFPPSEPPDGGYPPSFRLIVGGTQLRGSWYLSAIVRLQGFSSASPAIPPRRWSPKTVTTSSSVGRSKPGCDLGPTLSFKDVHHPRWGGGQAEPALYLPHGPRQRGAGRRRASSPPACRACGLAPCDPSCRRAAAAPCAREDHPRCRVLLGWRSCSGVVLPLHRDGAFTRRPVPHSSGRI
jgi:hypothetical protein